MHPYSTNSPANPKLVAVLVFVAIAMSTAASFLVNHVNNWFGWSVGGVSALSVFGLLYFGFDKYLWRVSWARRVLLVPDLSGSWRCDGMTIRKNGLEVSYPWSGTLTVRQSWSRVTILLKTGQSTSASVAASIYQEPGNGYRLIYYYDNQPGVAEKEISRHSGLCRLVFNENVDSAWGDYFSDKFSDKDRMTVGTMRLHREGNPNGQA